MCINYKYDWNIYNMCLFIEYHEMTIYCSIQKHNCDKVGH